MHPAFAESPSQRQPNSVHVGDIPVLRIRDPVGALLGPAKESMSGKPSRRSGDGPVTLGVLSRITREVGVVFDAYSGH